MKSCIQEDFLIERSVLVFVFVFVFLCVFVMVLVISRWTLVLSSFRRCMICEWQCSNSRNVAPYWWSAYRLKKEEEKKSHSKVGTWWVRQSIMRKESCFHIWNFVFIWWQFAMAKNSSDFVQSQQISSLTFIEILWSTEVNQMYLIFISQALLQKQVAT